MGTSSVCKGSLCRTHWAIALCFASATLTGLQASHPDACLWMGLNAGQTYALDLTISTVSIFLATFLLARLVSTHSHEH